MPPHGVKQQSTAEWRSQPLRSALPSHHIMPGYGIISSFKDRKSESVCARSLHRYVKEKLRQRRSCQSSNAQQSNAAVALDRNVVLAMWYRLCFYSVNQSDKRQAEISWELCWKSLDLALGISRGSQLSLIIRLTVCEHHFTHFQRTIEGKLKSSFFLPPLSIFWWKYTKAAFWTFRTSLLERLCQ